MNRRTFLSSLALTAAGLYVPKVLYFDMGKNLCSPICSPQMDKGLLDYVHYLARSGPRPDLIIASPELVIDGKRLKDYVRNYPFVNFRQIKTHYKPELE